MSEILLGWFTKPTILWSIRDYAVLFIEIVIFSYIVYSIYFVIEKAKRKREDRIFKENLQEQRVKFNGIIKNYKKGAYKNDSKRYSKKSDRQ